MTFRRLGNGRLLPVKNYRIERCFSDDDVAVVRPERKRPARSLIRTMATIEMQIRIKSGIKNGPRWHLKTTTQDIATQDRTGCCSEIAKDGRMEGEQKTGGCRMKKGG